MKKLQWMKWYPNDWMHDTRSLSIEAKGCLIDILMIMWNAPKRGIWEGTFQDFARTTGCPWDAAPGIIEALRQTLCVTLRNNLVTLENRRMVKERLHYENHANRQKRYRMRHKSDTNVTNKTPQDLKTPQDNTLTKRSVFIQPLPQDVTAYGASIGFKIDGAEFCDFYESKGWKVGTAPMKSWQAAVRTWKKRAPPSAIILPPKPREPDPEPEDCIGLEEIQNLAASLGKKMP